MVSNVYLLGKKW